MFRKPEPFPRSWMARMRAISAVFAVVGVAFLTWVVFGWSGGSSNQPLQQTIAHNPSELPELAPPGEAPLEQKTTALLPLKGEDKAGQSLKAEVVSIDDATFDADKGGLFPVVGLGPIAETNGPTTAKSSGPESIVRWNTPIAKGLALLEGGQPDQALAWSREQHKRLAGLGARTASANRILQARALMAQGKLAEARTIFAEHSKLGGPSEFGVDARFALAVCDAKGDVLAISDGELKRHAEGVVSWGSGMASYLLGVRSENGSQGRLSALEKARELYQKALFSNRLEAPVENDCLSRLNRLTERVVLNPRTGSTVPRTVFHKVVSGDVLSNIAKKYGVEQGMIRRVNRLGPKSFIRLGQVLKILTGPVEFRVDRWRLTGTLTIGGAFIRRYPVGIGPGDKTPAGAFTISTKLVNPDWYYQGRRIPFGDPENILGTRWLGFDKQENGGLGAGLGVHGTTLPESVPGRESKGCVRMHTPSAEEVYDFLPRGGKVVVK